MYLKNFVLNARGLHSLIIKYVKHEFSAGGGQQDSHEFASKMLEWLHGDMNR
jgi:hypothetical protein